MFTKNNEGLGMVAISDDVIAAYVIEAVTETTGVYDISGGFQEALSKNILGKELKSRGIKLSNEEDGLAVELNVIAEYGVNIPEIAWELQKNIKEKVEEMTEVPIQSINVHVQGVHFGDREATETSDKK